jgi:hypothetical protein
LPVTVGLTTEKGRETSATLGLLQADTWITIVVDCGDKLEAQTQKSGTIVVPGHGKPLAQVFLFRAREIGEDILTIHAYAGHELLATLKIRITICEQRQGEKVGGANIVSSLSPPMNPYIRLNKRTASIVVTSIPPILSLIWRHGEKTPEQFTIDRESKEYKSFLETARTIMDKQALKAYRENAVQLRNRLKSLGEKAINCLPSKLVDSLQRAELDNIQIIGEDHFFPFELIEVNDENILDRLGVFRRPFGQPDQDRIQFCQALFAYLKNDDYEPQFEDEAKGIMGLFTSMFGKDCVIDIKDPRNLDTSICSTIGTAARKNLHISCHGEFDGKSFALNFGGNAQIISADFSKRAANAIGLAFLNACGSDQDAIELMLDTSIPNRLLQNGTIAVVATMWNVKHASAKDYALAFYTALLDKKTLGEAAQAGRTAAKRHLDDGDPTYLAYCVYGDPQLRLRFSSK